LLIQELHEECACYRSCSANNELKWLWDCAKRHLLKSEGRPVKGANEWGERWREEEWKTEQNAKRTFTSATHSRKPTQLLPPTLKMAAPFMEKLAEYLDSPEPAVRLILSVLLGYPFALVYRWLFFHQSTTVIHLFHTFSGLALAIFNFVLAAKVDGKDGHVCSDKLYLSDGLSLDYYDGGKDPTKLSGDQKKSALTSTPSLLEVFGFSYYYGGFLVGPQFTLRSYQKLVSKEMSDVPGMPPNSVLPALKRFCLGLVALAIFTIGGPRYPDSYYLTDEFEAQPFWYRCVYILLWVKINLYKYISCWLITEGVCILSGLGYNDKNENGEHQWDSCANVRVWLFETTPLFTGTINSFNIITNNWVAKHVFKRLRFLGNKLVSQMFTLLFLAIWHGLHSGYLICFSMEFLIVNVEKQTQSLVRDSPLLTAITQSPLYPLLYVVQQTIHWLFMGYSLVPFCLFTYDKWLKVYYSVYFCGHIFFLAALLVLPYLRKVLVPRKRGTPVSSHFFPRAPVTFLLSVSRHTRNHVCLRPSALD
ncbi:hypothetical protein DNTS_032285, partial [Danionella cerebrum]